MKKTLRVFVLIVLTMGFVGTATAQAGGWFRASSTDTIPAGGLIWNSGDPETNPDTATTPHLGFSTSSNQCRVCHAVHLGGGTSWRLLKDGSTDATRSPGELQFIPDNTPAANEGSGNRRSTECMYCHDATSGVSSLRPYGMLFGKTVRGEHSLGATWIPDSSANDTGADDFSDGKSALSRKDPGDASGVLDCYQCHSVHGANILTKITAFGWGEARYIENYILRDDPAGNGYFNGKTANDGIDSIRPPWESSSSTNAWVAGQSKDTSYYPTKDTTDYYENSSWKYEVQAAWCGDCHNENPNITGPGDFRPNPRSHPIFGGKDASDAENPTVGGWMVVNGDLTQVSGGSPKGCSQCHLSGSGESSVTALSWPHQGEGAKLLGYNTTDHAMDPQGSFVPFESGPAKTGPGTSERAIPNMDQACLWCHRFDKTTGEKGVGITF